MTDESTRRSRRVGIVLAVVASAFVGLSLAAGAVTIAAIGGIALVSAANGPTAVSPGPLATIEPAPPGGDSPDDGLPSETFGGAPIPYEVGDCFMEPTPDYGHVQFVDCADPHDYEVYAEFELPDTDDGAYPGDDRVFYRAEEGCIDAFEGFIGVPWRESVFDFAYVSPDEETWTGYDDRLVQCMAVDPSGAHEGSLEGEGY